jgi:hypothetical protein
LKYISITIPWKRLMEGTPTQGLGRHEFAPASRRIPSLGADVGRSEARDAYASGPQVSLERVNNENRPAGIAATIALPLFDEASRANCHALVARRLRHPSA